MRLQFVQLLKTFWATYHSNIWSHCLQTATRIACIVIVMNFPFNVFIPPTQTLTHALCHFGSSLNHILLITLTHHLFPSSPTLCLFIFVFF